MNAVWRMKRLLALLGAAACCDAALIRAQYPQQSYQRAKTYADYYKEQYKMTHAPPKTGANYTINRHYYHNPNVSPYLNLVRPSTSVMPRYQTFVAPEVDRRARVKRAQAVRPVAPNYTSNPSLGGRPASNGYYDHWYGGFLGGP